MSFHPTSHFMPLGKTNVVRSVLNCVPVVAFACYLNGIPACPLTAAFGEESTPPVGAGKYTLQIRTTAVPEDQREVSIPIDLAQPEAIDGRWEFKFKTGDEWGNPFSGEGVCAEPKIRIGFTAVEKSTIITYHFVGNIGEDAVAQGEFKCFVDAEEVFDGTWSLSTRRDDDDEMPDDVNQQ